jgi:sigma-B regulation protein RsbU (phosphoserine phosphatase)
MPAARLDIRLLKEFHWWRFQLVLAVIAICVRLVLWVLHIPGNFGATLVGTFITANLFLVLVLLIQPYFAGVSRSQKWFWYLLLLVPFGGLANLLSEILIYLLFIPRSVPFWQIYREDTPFGLVITVVVGITAFAFDDSQSHLKQQNERLQSQVQLGLTEKEIHQSDLQQAHEIQVHLLPRETPQLPGFQVACAWQPARSVSGDYFDVLALGKDKMGLCVADVSGKGMAAALLMANLQASVKAFTQDGGNPSVESPAALCAKLNSVLCGQIAPGRFITFFYGILDRVTRKFTYENAGHCLPLLVHADGAIEFPAAYSGVLGLFSHWTYSDREVQLASGDVLVLMTDGVLEAWDKDEEEFGYQRLIGSVLASRNQGVHAIRQRILADVTAFCSNHFQDDASLIVVTVD